MCGDSNSSVNGLGVERITSFNGECMYSIINLKQKIVISNKS